MSEFSSDYSTVLSELLNQGRTEFDPQQVRYVCHTSTIPLATTVDEQSLLATDMSCVEVTHSINYQPGYDREVDYRCCKIHCMYFNSRGMSKREILRDNCPCGRIVQTEYLPGGEEFERMLQPLCFLQVLKEMRYKFGYRDQTQCESDSECCHNGSTVKGPVSNRPKIDMAEVMFCQNSQSILDSGYSRPLRDRVGFSGWESANTAGKVSAALDSLYWFRRYTSERFRTFLSLKFSSRFRWAKQGLTQALHTLNGQLVKKFLLFPCEMENYARLAKLTAELFEELVRDYFHDPRELLTEIPTEESIFLRIKDALKNCKRSFSSDNLEVRLSTFDVLPPRCKWGKFWHHCFQRLKRRILGRDEDYTLSPLWIYTMSGFSQTRNLGYLPPWIAEVKRDGFRKTISREKETFPASHLKLVTKLVMKRAYEEGIERSFLSNLGRKADEDFREVIHSLQIPLKPTASNNSTVSQGGKVEDARQLLSDGIDNGWVIPIRNFATGEISGHLKLTENLRESCPHYEDFIFWISFQILLNSFSKSHSSRYGNYFHNLPNSLSWENDLWKMQIVHISEPGKERNLTKTSALVAWVLTVASKVCQHVLAFSQDHRAGLVLSAQDWMHQRRISAESYESYWLYDQTTRKLIPGVWNGFQDWTESTDFIPRQIGACALQGFLTWIDFPKFFSGLVLLSAIHDYAVNETVTTNWEGTGLIKETVSTTVREGFMMSMPLTKTILHLMHDVNIGFVHEVIRPSVKVTERPRQVNPDVEGAAYGPHQLIPEYEYS